nr:E3 binding domain-containing protein [Actinomycetota bacterium]
MKEVVMPKSSMTMTEGELITWMVDDGTPVREGDPIAEIMTDKVEMEVEAPTDGRVGILVRAGATVPVGTPIGVILDEGEEAPRIGRDTGAGDLGTSSDEVAVKPAARGDAGAQPETSDGGARTPREPVEAKARASRSGNGHPEAKLRASPAARAMARKKDIDLAALSGSGPRGRITTDDVATAVDGLSRPSTGSEATAPPADGASGPGRSRSPDAGSPAGIAASGEPDAQSAGGVHSRERPRGIRAAMARRMAVSASIPQFTLFSETSFAAADGARRELAEAWGRRIGVNDIIVHAAARALVD